MSKQIQIGVIARRTETGDFLPSVPIMRELTPEREQQQKEAYDAAARSIAYMMRKYINNGGMSKL